MGNELSAQEQAQRQQGNLIIQKAEALQVVDDLTLQEAARFGQEIKGFADQIEAYWKPEIDSAYKTHRGLCDKKNALVNPLKKAILILKDRIGRYQVEQQQKREEEERRREAEAREKERKLREKKEREAEEALDKGQEEKAEALLEEAEEVYVAPKPVAAASKAEGVVTRYKYKVRRVVDIKLVPVEYLSVDISKVEKVKNALKEGIEIPGILFVKEPIVGLRSQNGGGSAVSNGF